MEVLCTYKTGTLTEGKISLSSYQDGLGKENPEVLNLSLICNSGFAHSHSFADSIDKAIIDFAESKNIKITGTPEKIYEMPFDFENRFMSIAVKEGGKTKLICKGSPEAIISRVALSGEQKKKLTKETTDMEEKGLRVIAIASKEINKFDPKLIKTELKHESLAVFFSFGYVPKKDLAEDFRKFENLGVAIKILTGDSEVVARKISQEMWDFFIKKF